MALPVILYWKNTLLSTIARRVRQSIQRCWGSMVAPAISIGSLPEKAGSEWVSLSQTSMAMPLIRILPPMVIMTSSKGDGFLRGRIARRSNEIPMIVDDATARIIAIGNGSFTAFRKKSVNIPPSITNSPWAKLMISVEL